MNIITKGKTINLDFFGTIGFDFDKAMVSFKFETLSEDMYFESRETAMRFYDEIIAGLDNEYKQLDLSYYKIYHNKVSVSNLTEFFKQQKEKYECYENQ